MVIDNEESREDSSLHLAFVVNNYPPRVGGVEMHVHSLAHALVEKGARVTVITLAATPGVTKEGGVEVIRLREHFRVESILGFPSLGTTRRLASLLRSRGVDVVSLHTRFFPMSWVGLRAARRAVVPTIHTEHGSGHVVSDSLAIRVASRAVDFTMGRRILRGATSVLGVSENVVDFVGRLSGRRDAVVFYNAINSAPAGVDRTPRRHLVFVGRLVPGKGADVFLASVEALAERGVTFSAEILGDGPLFDNLQAAIDDLGLAPVVKMRGRVGIDEVSRSLAGSILINPSTLAEGFQTTMLEALEVGGCVVSYDVPGAGVLRAQGFAVDVLPAESRADLVDVVATRLESGWSAASLADWHWSARAGEYIAAAERAVVRGAAAGAESGSGRKELRK